jgi:hypothetical protein
MRSGMRRSSWACAMLVVTMEKLEKIMHHIHLGIRGRGRFAKRQPT